MLSDRTKVVRGVMAFLIGCAVLGLFMGLRGALPGNVDPEYESSPVSTPSGVVVEAAPVTDSAPVVTNDTATNDVEEKDEEAEEEAAPAPEPEPEPAATPAPREEAPPADPVGDLIETPAAPPPPLSDLY